MGEIQQIGDEMVFSCPYPGPRPFNSEERNLFFGRDFEVDELFSLVNAHQAMLLYAQSGAGKTSLLNAGLVPRLAKEGVQVIKSPGFGGLIQKEFGLDRVENAYVFSTLMRLGEGQTNPEQLAQTTFADFLKEKEHLADKRGIHALRVVIFDQFEEIFTVYLNRWRDREKFFEQVGEALLKDPVLRVLFAIREDYIAQLDPYTALLPERLRTRFRLERLKEDAALLAITEPLTNTNRKFADGVAETLVEDLLKIQIESEFGEHSEVTEVRGEFVEPVQLQVVCQSIWNKLPADVSQIKHEHLLSVGNVDTALSQFYDDAIRAVVQTVYEYESKLRNWCEENLITSMGTRNMVYRGPETTGGLPNSATEVLEREHLIRAERRSGGRWYELTHDRFIKPIQLSNTAYRKRVEKASEEALVALREGDENLSKKKYEPAIEAYKKALSICRPAGLHFGEFISLKQLGDVLELSDRYEEALAYFRDALNVSINTGEWHRDIDSIVRTADLYFKVENFEEAVRLASIVIDVMPHHLVAYNTRAAAYWYWGRHPEAFDDYTFLLELSPESDARWILNGRGQVLAEMGAYREAVADLLKSIKLTEAEGESAAYAHNGLGRAYAGLGEYKKAFESFEYSIAKSPDNAWVYFNRAWVYILVKDIRRAIADLNTALEKKRPPLTPRQREMAKRYLEEEIRNG